MCGVEFYTDYSTNRDECCMHEDEDSYGDCDHKYFPFGPAELDVADYARDENIWLYKYVDAWHTATENGHDELKCYDGKCPERNVMTKE